jgi:hypothetical protein
MWLLQGAGAPFILRKDGEKFKLVGETYLHGFMGGKMANAADGVIRVLVPSSMFINYSTALFSNNFLP